MAGRWQCIRQAFEEICDLNAGQREAKLAQIDQSDPTLRADIEPLLAAYDAGSNTLDFLSPPDSPEQVSPAVGADRNGRQVGAYRLIFRLAVGGMSAVYLAEPIDGEGPPKVAIKFLSTTSPLSRRAQRRFRHERRLLRKLEHPNIARLLHADVTDDGCPYLVMEYVEGKPIDVYCEMLDLSIDERIDVFRGVCSAVQYAHQNLIVHRDLKPSNILVTSDGVPKLLDFGIAKLLEEEDGVPGATAPTTERFMTPEYASPEQVRGAVVSTASDVYSLGVVLYQLLTGRRPYSFKTQVVYEVARIICDKDPLKPSVAVSQTAAVAAPPEAEASGHGTRRGLRSPVTRQSKSSRLLAGDVDAIVMRAMRKEPGSRYSSVDQFADDLVRYRQGMPVRARKGTWRYRTSKFIRRNRAGVAAIVAVFAVLVASGVSSAWFGIQARREAQAATAARDEARRQASIAEAVNEFLNNDLLAAVAPEEQGKDVTMRTVLDVASDAIEHKFQDEPLVEASVRTTLGKTYGSLGELAAAAPHLKRAWKLTRDELGENAPATLEAMEKFTQVLIGQARYQEAEPLCQKGLDVSTRALGEGHSISLSFMDALAELYSHQGRYKDAEPLHVKALAARRRALGPDHLDTLTSLSNLALLYCRLGQYDKAESLTREAAESLSRVLGEGHPSTVVTMVNLFEVYRKQSRFEDAEQLYRTRIEPHLGQLGEDHPTVLGAKNDLGVLYYDQGRYDEAEPLYVRGLEAARRVFGNDHPYTFGSLNNLATLYAAQRRYQEAEPLFAELLEACRRVLGEEHPYTLTAMRNLGRAYASQGRFDEASPLFVKALQIQTRVLGSDHSETLATMTALARLYTSLGQDGEAEPLCAEALERSRKVLGPEHPTTLEAEGIHATLLGHQGEKERAEQMLDRVLQRQMAKLGQNHPSVRMTRADLDELRGR